VGNQHPGYAMLRSMIFGFKSFKKDRHKTPINVDNVYNMSYHNI